MLLADVNVFVYAFRRESPRHAEYRTWLQERLGGPEPFGVSEMVLSSFIRLVTHHRIYREASTPEAALAFCAAVMGAPATLAVRPGPRHWAIFVDLCRRVRARANVVPDAFLAAMAIEQGATWVTLDSGFSRFSPALRLEQPLEG